jgi:uncharacterized membrane protein
MSASACKKIFWGIALVTFGIAATFGLLGYWMTLPFAGLEIGVLAWAFESMGRHRRDYESLDIVGEELCIESRLGDRLEKRCANRHWAQLVAQKDVVSGHVRLAVRSHGQETEIGLFLGDEDRLQLGRSLKGWLDRAP